MRILFLCHKMPYPPNDGGVIATLNMIKGFAKAGDRVTVLTMQTYKHPYSINDLPENLTQNIQWHQVWVKTKINAIKAIFNLLFSTLPYNAQRFHSTKYRSKLIQLLSSQHFDVIQLEGLYVSSYLTVVRNYSRAMVSYRAHNVESEIWERLAIQEPSVLKRTYYKILARRIKKMETNFIPTVDLLVPITSKDVEFLSGNNKIEYTVCSAGMEESKFKITQPAENKTLFYIGALDWIPNQEGLMWFIEKVWNPLYLKFPDWKFVIAGRQAPLGFVEKIKKYPIVFLGEVPDSTEFIDKYQLMVVPLLSGSGMRIKIVEAMARGKCVVTSTTGAEGIDAKNFSEIIIADEPLQISSILENLFQNTALIKEYGENAFKFASSNFMNEPIINGLREFYQHKINTLNGIS